MHCHLATASSMHSFLLYVWVEYVHVQSCADKKNMVAFGAVDRVELLFCHSMNYSGIDKELNQSAESTMALILIQTYQFPPLVLLPYWHLWNTCRNIHSTCIWVDFHEGRWWGRWWCNTYRQERPSCHSSGLCQHFYVWNNWIAITTRQNFFQLCL